MKNNQLISENQWQDIKKNINPQELTINHEYLAETAETMVQLADNHDYCIISKQFLMLYGFVLSWPRRSRGSKKSRAANENSSPETVPKAKSNQNTSCGPSEKKGSRPSKVDATVRRTGRILYLKALRYRCMPEISRERSL